METRARFGGIDLQAVLDASLDASFILAQDGRFLDANQTALDRYGYTRAEFQSMSVRDLSANDLRPQIPKKLSQLVLSGEIFEWKHQCKDGTEIPVEIYAQPILIQGEPVIFSSVRDISKRKKTLTALNEQKHFLDHVLNTEPGSVYIYDLIGKKYIYVNSHWLSTFGYTPEDPRSMGADLLSIAHPDDLPEIESHHERWLTSKTDEIRNIEYRIRSNDGEWHWINARERPFSRDPSGQVTQILGIAHDVTKRILAEKDRELFVSLVSRL